MLEKNKKAAHHSISSNDHQKLLNQNSIFAVKEAYNSIRTNLFFTQQGEKCPIFVVTSPTANNGKTINSANLAINFAQMGKKTLVIDADMRNPSLHKLFSLSSRNGLSEILAGLTDNITVTKTGIENLSILTSGKIPPNPTELLSSPRMDKLLDFVKEHYDCVFIDTPPINIVTDATVFAQKTTGYILIVKTDTTNVPELKASVTTLQSINANILGFIINDTNSEKKKYYSYYRKYSRSYSYNYKYTYGNDKR